MHRTEVKINWSQCQKLQLTVLLIFKSKFLLQSNCNPAWRFFIIFFGITENSRRANLHFIESPPTKTRIGTPVLRDFVNRGSDVWWHRKHQMRLNDRRWNPFIKPSSAATTWTLFQQRPEFVLVGPFILMDVTCGEIGGLNLSTAHHLRNTICWFASLCCIQAVLAEIITSF